MVLQCLNSTQCLNAYTKRTLLRKQTKIQEKVQADFYFDAFICGGNKESYFPMAVVVSLYRAPNHSCLLVSTLLHSSFSNCTRVGRVTSRKWQKQTPGWLSGLSVS